MSVQTKWPATLAALLFLAGCGGVAGAEAEAPAATPTETLFKGVPTAAGGVFHFAIKGGVQPLSGTVDAGHKAAVAEMTESIPDDGFTLSVKVMMIGDVYKRQEVDEAGPDEAQRRVGRGPDVRR